MENIRKISHDIKNHLEALRGNVDYQQKQEYIDGIESKLDIYQSYYKTGNACQSFCFFFFRIQSTA